jgi:hypothetical protein
MGDIKNPNMPFSKQSIILGRLSWLGMQVANLWAYIRLSTELTPQQKEWSKAAIKSFIKELEATHADMESDN